MTGRNGTIGGVLAVVASFIGATAISFTAALKTFWWCPQGGCSLASHEAKLYLLGNVVGLCILFLGCAILLWFGSAAALRVFSSRAVAERVFLPAQQPTPAWYSNLMRKWLALLWN